MRSVSHGDRSIGDDQLRLRMRAHATGQRRTGRRERGSDRKDRALMLRRDSLASRFSSSAFTFGISAMLGYRLVLRIRDLPSTRPCVFNPAGTPKDASLLMASPGDPIMANWPDLFRCAAPCFGSATGEVDKNGAVCRRPRLLRTFMVDTRQVGPLRRKDHGRHQAEQNRGCDDRRQCEQQPNQGDEAVALHHGN